MSSNDSIDSEDSVTSINGIGPKRSKHLSVSTVGELAEAKAQSVYNELGQTGMTPGEVEDVVATAREAAGIDDEPKVYTKPEDGAGEKVPEPPAEDGSDEASVEVTEESFGGDVDSFVDSGDTIDVDEQRPEDCETVLLIGGDDAFDADGEFGDASGEELAGLVQSRLVEEGFEPETIYAVGSGMGRKAVNAWAQFTANEHGPEALPELKQIAVQASGRYPNADDFRERNEALLEAVDGVCVVANGEYVGMWVNMVNDRDDVIIETPDYDADA